MKLILMIFRMQSLSKLKRTICKMSSPKNDSPHVVVKPCNMVARQSVPAPNKQLVDLKWVVLTDDRIGMLTKLIAYWSIFHVFCCLISFFKIKLFLKKIFQEYHQNVKKFGP